MEDIQTTNITPAERLYRQHIEGVKRYQKNHPEKAREYTMRYLKKIRTENPEKHEQIKQKKREYYRNVLKPRMEKLKKDKKEKEETEDTLCVCEKCFLLECCCEADRLQVLKDDEDARNRGFVELENGRWIKIKK